jgi:tRNA(Ile)-lysidine synthase
VLQRKLIWPGRGNRLLLSVLSVTIVHTVRTTSDHPQEPVEAALRAMNVPQGSRLVVGVSGGPDSVALLDALWNLASERSWTISVGHINHGLRGEEGNDDERFVVNLAKELGFRCDVARVDTTAEARIRKLSVEHAARELRYAALEAMRRDSNADLLLTAHTEDDQAETLLLRLLRGTGIVGLAGIYPVRGLIRRPLLGVTREEVVMYLQARGRGYRLDSSNLDPRYLRNRVRREVMPTLEHLHPGAAHRIAGTTNLVRPVSGYLSAEAAAAIDLMAVHRTDTAVTASLSVWRTLHEALRRETLRVLIAQAGARSDVSVAHIAQAEDALLSSATCPVTLPMGLAVSVRGSRLCFAFDVSRLPPVADSTVMRIPDEVNGPFGVLRAEAIGSLSEGELNRLVAVCGPFHALCDAELLGDELRIRGRQPGDRIRPVGRGGSRKVQDLFVDLKVPRAHRHRVAVIENASGIVWIPGYALDQRVTPRDSGSVLVHLMFRPNWDYAGATIQRPFRAFGPVFHELSS